MNNILQSVKLFDTQIQWVSWGVWGGLQKLCERRFYLSNGFFLCIHLHGRLGLESSRGLDLVRGAFFIVVFVIFKILFDQEASVLNQGNDFLTLDLLCPYLLRWAERGHQQRTPKKSLQLVEEARRRQKEENAHPPHTAKSVRWLFFSKMKLKLKWEKNLSEPECF